MVLNPRVVEGLLSRESLVDVLLDQALQELLCLRGVLRERLVIEMKVSFDYVANNF